MKKILLFSLLFLSLNAYADQWYVLNREQAVEAKSLLDKQSFVLSFCACCDNSPKELVKISKVKIEKWESSDKNDDLYFIKLDGVNPENGKVFSEGVDLAYLHIIKSDGIAYNVADELSLEVDPCTDPFPYDVKGIKKNKKDKKRNRKSKELSYYNSVNENSFLTKIATRFS